MLKVMSADRKRLRARAPRIEVYGRANIKVGNRVISVDLCDLSQGGVKLPLPEPIEAENEVIVSISGLEDRKSLIRWQKDGRPEERRVGQACVSTCNFRWSPDHSKKKHS